MSKDLSAEGGTNGVVHRVWRALTGESKFTSVTVSDEERQRLEAIFGSVDRHLGVRMPRRIYVDTSVTRPVSRARNVRVPEKFGQEDQDLAKAVALFCSTPGQYSAGEILPFWVFLMLIQAPLFASAEWVINVLILVVCGCVLSVWSFRREHHLSEGIAGRIEQLKSFATPEAYAKFLTIALQYPEIQRDDYSKLVIKREIDRLTGQSVMKAHGLTLDRQGTAAAITEKVLRSSDGDQSKGR